MIWVWWIAKWTSYVDTAWIGLKKNGLHTALLYPGYFLLQKEWHEEERSRTTHVKVTYHLITLDFQFSNAHCCLEDF